MFSKNHLNICVCYAYARSNIMCITHVIYNYKKELGYEEKYYINVDILCVVAVDVINK